MSKKGMIRNSGTFRSGTFLGTTPKEADDALRQAVIEQQWHNYMITNDFECLAQICEHADYFGNQQIGKELASVFRSKKRRKKGYVTELEWVWADRFFKSLDNDPDWAEAPDDAKRVRVFDLLGIQGDDRIKWADRFRKWQAARSKIV
jgi:hypothetical protein